MDWTKILDKGWINVIQTIIIIALFIFIGVSFSSTKRADLSIREDIEDTRKLLDQLEKNNDSTIELIEGVIDSTTRIIGGLNELADENQRARDIVSELESDNIGHTRRIRAVQDSTLNSELAIDGVRRVIEEIERENGYNGSEE